MEQGEELMTAKNEQVVMNGSVVVMEDARIEALSYWMDGITTNIIVFLGLLGNGLTMTVLSRRSMRSSTNYYLFSLAIWDSVVLICTEVLIGLPGIPQTVWYVTYVFPYMVVFIYPVALAAQTATIWLTVSFTVERYIAVCHPLRATSMCTISRAKQVIAVVSLLSTLYNVPRWFEYSLTEVVRTPDNSTLVGYTSTALGQNDVYMQIYFTWLYLPMMCIVPLCILSVLNLFLIRSVRQSQKYRKELNVKQSRENNVTLMLVSVVMVFIVCQFPALVYNVVYAFDHENIEKRFYYLVLSHFRNFLVNLNSAVNFILYCMMGQKFRRTFLLMFFPRCVNGRYSTVSRGNSDLSPKNRHSTSNVDVHGSPANFRHLGSSFGRFERGFQMKFSKKQHRELTKSSSAGERMSHDVMAPSSSRFKPLLCRFSSAGARQPIPVIHIERS